MASKQRRAQGSQRAAPRPPDDAAIPLGTVLVSGQRYEHVATSDGREAVVVPGVAGTDEADEIPTRRVRFIGTPVCVEVSVKQLNRFLSSERTDPFVGVMTGWSIALDGAVVYGGLAPAMDAGPALIAAAATLPRLLSLPIRPQDREDWYGLAVYLDGRPAVVVGLRGSFGELVLAVGEDEVVVDLLSDRVSWPTRTAETSPR